MSEPMSYEEFFDQQDQANPTQCPLCLRQFRRANDCTNHMKRAHGCSPGTSDEGFAVKKDREEGRLK